MRVATVAAAAIGALLLLALGVALLRASSGAPERRVLLDGLVAPRGLALLDDGSLLIAEGGGGRLLQLHADGRLEVLDEGIPAALDGGPGGHDPVGISGVVKEDGVVFYVVGEFRGDRFRQVYRLHPGEEREPLVPHRRAADPFARSPFANPYDLLALGDALFVSDSGQNAVFHLGREGGAVTTFAELPRVERPGEERFASVEPVPTGIVRGPDGAMYVATLTGYPFPPGAAAVYRLEDRDGDGAATAAREMTRFADGFSAATDLAFAPGGCLLVTEYSRDMRALVEEHGGTHRAAREPGRLVRWCDGERELIADDLVSPTSVVAVGGRAVVSEEFAGRVVEIVLPERPRS